MASSLRPFRDGDTHSTFRNHLEEIRREIEALDNQYVLKASPTELEEHFAKKVLLEPLQVSTEQLSIEDQRGISVDVSRDFRRAIFPGEQAHVRGTQLTISIPFLGNPVLWKIRPSTYSHSGYPEIYVHQDRIAFLVQFPDDSADQQELRREIDRQVKSLADAVQNQLRDVQNHNASAPQSVKAWLAGKRERALSTVSTVQALGIPVRRRDMPDTYSVPVQRKPIAVGRPAVKPEPFAPEPVLEEAVYEQICTVLRSMSLVIERNPNSFRKLDEESIRDHFLMALNSQFQGAATGETFNMSGKTDILIRVEGKNIFIAECKFWLGPAAFGEAIDQLLGYLTWRDCKCALLVFNRNKNSSAVAEKMHETMTGRKEHRRTVAHTPDKGGRYVFVKDSEPGREIVASTLLFDVPTD